MEGSHEGSFGKGSPLLGRERQRGEDTFRFGSDVRQSLTAMRAAMVGERRFIFVGLLTTCSQPPFHEELVQRYLADAKERFQVYLEQRSEAERTATAGAGAQTDAGPPPPVHGEMSRKEAELACVYRSHDFTHKPEDSPEVHAQSQPYTLPRPTLKNPALSPAHSRLAPPSYLESSQRQLAGGSSSSSFMRRFSPTAQPRQCSLNPPQYQIPPSSLPSALAPPPAADRDPPPDYLSAVSQDSPPAPRNLPGSALEFMGPQSRCRTPTCNFYGHPETDNYCSCCYRQAQQSGENESVELHL